MLQPILHLRSRWNFLGEHAISALLVVARLNEFSDFLEGTLSEMLEVSTK